LFCVPAVLAIHEVGIKADTMQQIPAAMSPQENIG